MLSQTKCMLLTMILVLMCQVYICDKTGEQSPTPTPLMVAILQENEPKFMELINSGKVDGKEEIEGGWTPLHAAASKGRADWIELLLDLHPALLHLSNHQQRTALHEAVAESQFEAVEALINADANIEARDAVGDRPLHVAASTGNLDIVKLLLKKKAKASAQNNNHATPLYYAAAFGHFEIIKALLAANADISLATPGGITPLHEAAIGGNVEVVRILLENGADVNSGSVQNWTPLHNAAQFNREEVLDLLLQSGADPNIKHVTGRTALFMACLNGTSQMVEALLQHNANPEIADSNSTYPIHIAAFLGDVQKVKSLIAAGANVNVRDAEGASPLHKAAFSERDEVIKVLLEASANTEIATYERRWTPLLVAAGKSSESTLQVLLEGKAAVNHKTFELVTALQLVANQGNSKATRLLLEHGADANVFDLQGWSPLHTAAQANRANVIKELLRFDVDADLTKNSITALHLAATFDFVQPIELLVKHGADINAQDAAGFTPLHHAAFRGSNKAVKKLLQLGADTSAHCKATTEFGSLSPLQLAQLKAHSTAVSLLAKYGSDLSELDVAKWLEAANLGKYKAVFQKNQITGDVLPQLTFEILRDELNIKEVGTLLKFKKAISAMQPERKLRHDEL